TVNRAIAESDRPEMTLDDLVHRFHTFYKENMHATQKHLGKLLSEHWKQGQAGGHKALAGGQILFESLLDEVPSQPDEANQAALIAMTKELELLFSPEVNPNE
ncbi:MAG: hypothetical protein QF699_06620, partial [Candidatus Poseidoniaceae archaeon]|nr:hypothetical protein [Candidatus Poseidoniaceae archaeon]